MYAASIYPSKYVPIPKCLLMTSLAIRRLGVGGLARPIGSSSLVHTAFVMQNTPSLVLERGCGDAKPCLIIVHVHIDCVLSYRAYEILLPYQ